MIGAVLAGGYGKRLRPITDAVPKPLIEIKKNYTILDKQILQFRYSGIREVFLLVGYLYEKIKQRYSDSWKGVEINYVVEKKPLGTAGAVKNLVEVIDEDVIIRNGDVVTDVNLKEMMRFHESGMTMLVVPLVSPYGIVSVEGNSVRGFVEKPRLNYWINGGIYIVSKEIFGRFSDVSKGDLEKLVFPGLASEGLIRAYRERCFWKSVDSVKDLEFVRKEFENRCDKPWGYEKIVMKGDKYTVKKIYVMKGESVSLGPEISGTVYVEDGLCKISGSDPLGRGDTVNLKAGERYSVQAMENTLLLVHSVIGG